MANKYLEKIAEWMDEDELEKEAANWNKIVQRIKAKNPSPAEHARASIALDRKMAGKIKQHVQAGDKKKATKVGKNMLKGSWAAEKDTRLNMTRGERKKYLKAVMDQTGMTGVPRRVTGALYGVKV